MKTNRLMLYSYTGYFFIGLISIMFAPLLPLIIEGYGITPGIAGSLFPVRFAGIFAGGILGGILSDRYGRKAVIIAGSLIQMLGFLLLVSSATWTYGLLAFGAAGFGTGLTNTTLNALVADANSDRKGSALNKLHGIYAAGCLIGPLIAGTLSSIGYGWKPIFYASSFIWLLYAIISVFISYPRTEMLKKSRFSFTFRKLDLDPILLLLFFVSFIYNGSATGLVGWINTYMKDLEFSLLFGSGMVSVFYAGLMLGRFLCGRLSEKIGYVRIITICAVGSLIFYPAALFTLSAWSIVPGVFFTGLFMSGLHPTGLAYASTRYPEKAGSVTALLASAMSLGAMTVPWATGIVADASGFRSGMGIGFVLLVILLPVVFLLSQKQKKGI
jgi:MFS transporter, FHS family, glucose/mannose:H+ symporter